MNEIVIFDTSVIIDQARNDRHSDRLRTISGAVRNSSVVLAELWRGASSQVDRRGVEALERRHPTLTPAAKNWLDSGQILRQIRAERGFEPHKLRDLHFDVLIALTARNHGARLITSNRTDFELIREYLDFALEVW